MLYCAAEIFCAWRPGTTRPPIGQSGRLQATGLLLLLIPDLPWQVQLVAFALFSIGAIVAARVFLTTHPLESDQPALNRRGEQYIGRVFTLDQAVVNGEGKIRVDDSTWKVHGKDCPAGTRVKVVGADGVVLQVAAEE